MGLAMSSRRRRGFGVERSGGLLALLRLQFVLEYGRAGATRPPVTAVLLAANALVYLRPGARDDLLPLLSRASFNPYLIIKVLPKPPLPILSSMRWWVLCGFHRSARK